jgi:hypothetical protein
MMKQWTHAADAGSARVDLEIIITDTSLNTGSYNPI